VIEDVNAANANYKRSAKRTAICRLSPRERDRILYLQPCNRQCQRDLGGWQLNTTYRYRFQNNDFNVDGGGTFAGNTVTDGIAQRRLYFGLKFIF
jgi:hypothetical protein